MGDLLVGGGVDEGSSMVDGMVGERSGVVDGVGNNWGVGNSMVCVSVVSSDNLAVSTVGHSVSASVGEVGAGGSLSGLQIYIASCDE